MKISELRHRITIESLERVSDGQGGDTQTWTTHVKVWAKIKPSHGPEFFDSEQIKNIITHNITIRYRKDIKTDMRISFKDRIFTIHSIINVDEKNCFLRLVSEEIKS